MKFAFAVAAVSVVLSAAGQPAFGQYRRAEMPVDRLPEEHDYQRVLRGFMATLTEEDFSFERREIEAVEPAEPEAAYRLWLLTLHMPRLEAVPLPAAGFTLAAIESARGLAIPADTSASQAIAWLAGWDYPGNPHRGSRALKLRGFMLAAVDLIMLDHLYEHDPQGANRSDYLGGNLIWIGYTYRIAKDVLPAGVQAAFEAGLKKHVLRLDSWGPTGAMTDMDLFAPVGLWFIHGALDDPEVSRVAERYSRQLFTDPRYFNAAGYFVDNGCFDTSYNGISLYFANWAALATDWGFAREATDQAFRLRAHLCFPDPSGGGSSGPSHPSSRTSGDVPRDQWQFPHRPYGAAMVSAEAIAGAPLPQPEAIRAAAVRIAGDLNQALAKTPELEPRRWSEGHWSQFLNYPHEHYQPGSYARRLQLEAERSPLLQPLYRREGRFLREFGDAFVISKSESCAVAVFTGPVGRPVGHNGLPYGYGGGQLSVFWTPESGVVIAGRRRGVQGGVYDSYDEWRDWPNHAVSGLTTRNELVSSSRIQLPAIQRDIAGDAGRIVASGTMPKYAADRKSTTPSGMHSTRTFTIDPAGLRVRTVVASDGAERFTELWETIPVLVRETPGQQPTTIEFRTGAAWAEAPSGTTAAVEAVRLARFDGAAVITFAEPQAIALGEKPWKDGFQTQAECRNLRIDLLAGSARPAQVESLAVEYTISAGR